MKTRIQSRSNIASAVYASKEEYVADYLRTGILAGDIERGARLKQAELAAQLGLSITPVREALKLLAAEGYVHAATHRGSIVAAFDVAAAAEIVELRALLETRLMVAAMQRMTLGEMEHFEILAQAFERAVEAGDAKRARGANYQFHRFLFGLAREPLTFRFVQVLWAKYPFDIMMNQPERPRHAAQEHARIIDAVISRNQEAAQDALREHIYSGWNALRPALGSEAPHGEPIHRMTKGRP